MSIVNDIPSLNQSLPTTLPPSTHDNKTSKIVPRKRKHIDITSDTPSTLTQQCSFVIKPHASSHSQHEAPQAFRNLLSIPRSALPLTFLDSSTTPNRLFAANLPALEGQEYHQTVLIVRNEQQLRGPLHAVERVKQGVYILCRLAEWVRLDDFQQLAPLALPSRAVTVQGQVQDKDGSASWWKSCIAPEPDTAALPSLPSLQPRKAPRLSMRRPTYMDQEQEKTVAEIPTETHIQDAAVAPPDQSLEVETEVKTAEDVFARFITNYLDTLYLSRTPLAFFAKGPVSRARAAFVSAQIESPIITDLVAFLRTMVHSSSMADKKYKIKLPDMLKQLPAPVPGLDLKDISPAKEKKKRKKRRLKPDKHGLLPEEDEYFEKWWYGDDTSTTPADETAEQSLRRRTAQLRTRETFMQLILVLEVLSLEAMPEVQDKKIVDPESQSELATDDSQQKKSKSKAKKSDDLSLLLELLIDKLSIWHSLDAGLMLDDSKPDTAQDKTPDELRNFCIEVIIPFYLSRIPVHAANVNKKLGGPSSSTTKTSKTSSRSKPGEPESRQKPDKKPRKPLQRVATETAANNSAISAPLSLRHSATDPQSLYDRLKREASETPSLSTIPSFRRDSQTPGLSQPRRASGVQQLRAREVDFASLAAAQEAKKKKKAEIDAKLREAISGLKRPNRLAASKEIADVAEQRRLMANARARGSVRGARGKPDDKSKGADHVHVAATPSHGRTSKDFIAATPMRMAQPLFAPRPSYSQGVLPSSGPSVIPSSTIKPPASMLADPPPRFAHSQPNPQFEYQEVEEDITVPATGRRQRTVRYELTPSKASASNTLSVIDDSPILSRNGIQGRAMSPVREEEDDDDDLPTAKNIFQTPSKPSRIFMAQGTPSRSSDRRNAKEKATAVAATPVKASKGDKHITGGTAQKETQGKSIYDVLGWNDNFSD